VAGASGVRRSELFTGDGYIYGSQTYRLSGVIRCGPEGVCSERCRQLVMGSVSRPEDGGPSRTGTADILSAPGT